MNAADGGNMAFWNKKRKQREQEALERGMQETLVYTGKKEGDRPSFIKRRRKGRRKGTAREGSGVIPDRAC